jgi:hypothetical protein
MFNLDSSAKELGTENPIMEDDVGLMVSHHGYDAAMDSTNIIKI